MAKCLPKKWTVLLLAVFIIGALYSQEGTPKYKEETPAVAEETTPAKKGGVMPGLASCIVGPRVGLEMNEGVPMTTFEQLYFYAKLAQQALSCIGPILVFLPSAVRTPLGYVSQGLSLASFACWLYFAYQGYQAAGPMGAFASACLGPRVGTELPKRKIRMMEWLGLVIVGRLVTAWEAYQGKTMTEIAKKENLEK